MNLTSRRNLLTTGAAALFGLSLGSTAVLAQQPVATQPPADRLPGGLSEEQLGQMIGALGIKPDKQQQRYDFAFKAKMGEQEWELSMSSVLSRDGKSIWLMAWLDELPKSANDVPRNALLRLLAKNDEIGSGKFFAYIPANRRFVLQQVVPNENMTSAKFKYLLQDLGTSVVDSYDVWSVAKWTEQPGTAPAANASAGTPAAQQPPPARTADGAGRFEQPIRR
jgi:hypothetical protein